MPGPVAATSASVNQHGASSSAHPPASTAFQLSVIIPALNEESCIGGTIDHVRGQAHEVYVVDGGSTDATREVASQHGARVIVAPCGRGRQQNAGAEAASGNTLLFLHADTRLPPNFSDLIRRALDQPGVSAGARSCRSAPATSSATMAAAG